MYEPNTPALSLIKNALIDMLHNNETINTHTLSIATQLPVEVIEAHQAQINAILQKLKPVRRPDEL